MGSVYIVVLLTDKHNLWGRLQEWQDISRKVAGYENPRAGHAPPLRVPIYMVSFRDIRRGRIYASRAVCPLGCIVGTAATGGIYAAPTEYP